MKYILVVGYLGREYDNVTSKKEGEPVETMDKIISFFSLEKEPAIAKVDLELVWQKPVAQTQKIWKEINAHPIKWNALKPKLLKLLELGEQLLPVAFDVDYLDVQIALVDGEDYFIIISENRENLQKLKTLLEKDADKRITPCSNNGQKIVLKPMPEQPGNF